MKVIRWFLAFWKRFSRRTRIGAVVCIESMADLPKRLGGSLFVVGKPVPKWAIMNCPCGCAERIDINLMQSRQPCWHLSLTAGVASLQPSVWVPRDRCGSHFLLQRNRIVWVD
jgi:uncharacterized protein DUF6527